MPKEAKRFLNEEMNHKLPAKLPQDGNKEDSSALA